MGELSPNDAILKKNWIWDVLEVKWGNTCITLNHHGSKHSDEDGEVLYMEKGQRCHIKFRKGRTPHEAASVHTKVI